jgi:glycosyltransferase involved in cell wall biosynthesis
MRAAVCTIVAKNYLPFARVLMKSVRQRNPELRRIVILADRIDGYFDPTNEPFEVILSEELDIPNAGWFHFKYTILELSTAVKPYALEFLRHRYNLDLIVYLDPDIKVYAPLDGLLAALNQCNMILTPHLTAVLQDQTRPTDLDILRSGAYNLGFIALRFNPEMSGFLRWWQAKLYDHCFVDLVRGLFVDQRWMDLAPGLFSGVFVNRQPGYNVAYWNLPHREVRRTPAGYTVNGEPLYFFHFSGFDPANPERFSRHQDRYRLGDLKDARDLVLEYANDLLVSGYETCRTWPYAYGRFEHGVPITDAARPIHHVAPELLERVSNPFSREAFGEFVRVWNEPVVRSKGERAGVTRLAYHIYRTRADVQAAMPNVFGGDCVQFLDWMLSSGISEHRIDPVFLAPVWDALQAARKRKGGRTETAGETTAPNGAAPGGPLWYKLGASVFRLSPSELNQTIDDGRAGFRLTRLAQAIYESRVDLQRSMPDPAGRDGARFLLWILTYGVREYGLSDAYLAPLRGQWAELLASLSLPERLRYRTLLFAARCALGVRDKAARLSGSSKYRGARKRLRRARVRDDDTALEASAVAAPFGLNLVGYLRAEMGVGESSRSALAAAQAAGLPTAVQVVTADDHYREEHPLQAAGSASNPYCFNMLHINADQTLAIGARLGSEFFAGRYNIGYWAWELEEFPQRWDQAFKRYHEIWTPSSFCQDGLARRSPIPVVRIPHCIALGEPALIGREALGLPAQGFLFLCMFDMLSIMERKNPAAAIQAFRGAFEGHADCHLVVKVNNAQGFPRNLALLRDMAGGAKVVIIDKVFSRSETVALLGHADCLVSLHRSEGFGLVLAEAMLLAKPVIATAYSGNMDFTKPGNSLLVGFRMKPVGKGCEPYDEHCLWADPSIGEAVVHMRAVFESAQLRHETGSAARSYVSTYLSPEAVGRQMRERLQTVWRSFGQTAADRDYPTVAVPTRSD